ncbi:hypothetical protein VNO77_38924 [Canavalia gladiata]|uniref:Uncharacterized protein n=1 Tax=Canavalia gladiata TaxID=3824 RepID=A0AAN9PXS3_CANGL
MRRRSYSDCFCTPNNQSSLNLGVKSPNALNLRHYNLRNHVQLPCCHLNSLTGPPLVPLIKPYSFPTFEEKGSEEGTKHQTTLQGDRPLKVGTSNTRTNSVTHISSALAMIQRYDGLSYYKYQREVKSIHYWNEVAPAILISQHRRSSNFVKLEPIIEEERQESGLLHRGVVTSFPLLLSGLLYIFLCRGLF